MCEVSPRLGLVLILLHDAAGVVTTKSEGVGEGSTHSALLSLVEREVHVVVDVFIAVVLIVIDGGRNDIVLHREAANDSFHCTSSTEEVTGHRLGGGDVELVSVLTKHLADSLYF